MYLLYLLYNLCKYHKDVRQLNFMQVAHQLCQIQEVFNITRLKHDAFQVVLNRFPEVLLVLARFSNHVADPRIRHDVKLLGVLLSTLIKFLSAVVDFSLDVRRLIL